MAQHVFSKGRRMTGLRLAGAGLLMMVSAWCWGAEFSASFKGTDIQEFINTVSKNLNKTVIIDPAVR